MNNHLDTLPFPFINIIEKHKITSLTEGFSNEVANRSFQFDSESENSLENIELLRLEVTQLKRENQFLKTKIQELKRGIIIKVPNSYKKQSINSINVLKRNANELQIQKKKTNDSILFIFNEIQNVLKSLAQIHRIQFDEMNWIPSKSNENFQLNSETNTHQLKISQQFKTKINKKLAFISLQKEEDKYTSLLEVFQEFYKSYLQDQKYKKQRLEKMVQETLKIGKNLIEKASIKKYEKSMKSSCIYSFITQTEENMDSSMIKGKENNFGLLNVRTHFQKHEMTQSTIEDHQTRQF